MASGYEVPAVLPVLAEASVRSSTEVKRLDVRAMKMMLEVIG